MSADDESTRKTLAISAVTVEMSRRKPTLSETALSALEAAGKSPADVDRVLFSDDGYLRRCSFEDFMDAASRVRDGWHVDRDLVIVGEAAAWWLERVEDDDDHDAKERISRWRYREGVVDSDHRHSVYPPTPSQLMTS